MKKNGFTLIELVVVIAIIGMLFAIVTALFSGAQAKSRDAKRVSDIKELQNALALFINSNGIYPICATEKSIQTCLATFPGPGTMPVLPKDPLNTGSTCGDANSYIYCYSSNNGTDYTLRYHLETNSIKPPGWYNVTP